MLRAIMMNSSSTTRTVDVESGNVNDDEIMTKEDAHEVRSLLSASPTPASSQSPSPSPISSGSLSPTVSLIAASPLPHHHRPSILLPSSLLSISDVRDDRLQLGVTSPLIGGGNSNSALAFASTHIITTESASPSTSVTPTSAAGAIKARRSRSNSIATDGTAQRCSGGWIESICAFIMATDEPTTTNDSFDNVDDDDTIDASASSLDPSSTTSSSYTSSPSSSSSMQFGCASWFSFLAALIVAASGIFFMLLLGEYALEAQRMKVEVESNFNTESIASAMSSPASSQSISPVSPSLSSPPSPHLLNSTLLTLHDRVLSIQRTLNTQLQLAGSKDLALASVQTELANRDEVLLSLRKIVLRLKTLQLEHTTLERRAREDSVAHQFASLSAVDLAKYKDKLIHLLFGNQTLDDSRRAHAASLAHASSGFGEEHSQRENELFKLVQEAQDDAGVVSAGSTRLATLFGGGGPGSEHQTELKIETVMRIQELEGRMREEEEEDDKQRAASATGASGSGSAIVHHKRVPSAPADKLIDIDKNEYILSKPGDATKMSVDSRLVLDLGIVIVASALCGMLASLIHQPILLGYLVGGSLIGPGGFKMIGQFIQIETLAQFGATFLLFALGVEFSVAKLRKVKNVALLGGALQLALLMGVVAGVGIHYWNLKVKTAVFIGAVVSMSSTTVVVKSLQERQQIGTLCGQVMLGLLIVQDLFLSLMLALLNLARVPGDRLASESAWLAVRFGVLALVVVACMYLWPICLRLLDRSKSHDLFLLGLVALCVFLTVVSEKIISSPEVGAFLSGILISSSPGASAELTHRSLKLFGPIRDMFGALFFSSIGMLIDPAFLLEKAGTILLLVLATVVLKSLLTLFVVRIFGYSIDISIRTGLGLSQIGEFAFVLASEGLAVGLLTKELYFLILGTTAVSIFITPFILTASTHIVKLLNIDDNEQQHIR